MEMRSLLEIACFCEMAASFIRAALFPLTIPNLDRMLERHEQIFLEGARNPSMPLYRSCSIARERSGSSRVCVCLSTEGSAEGESLNQFQIQATIILRAERNRASQRCLIKWPSTNTLVDLRRRLRHSSRCEARGMLS